ncbi:MAG: ComEC/Rec2 family competence protein, partial [Bacteroidota bacterium]
PNLDLKFVVGAAALCFVIHILVSKFSGKSYYDLGSWVALPAIIIFVILGYYRAALNEQLLDPSHYRHIEEGQGWEGTIISPGTEKANFILYEAEINNVFLADKSIEARGEFNFYLRKSEDIVPLGYGDRIMVKGMPYEIPSPKNPDEFNYSAYMRTRHIYDQQFVDSSDLLRLDKKPPNQILALGYQVRSFFQDKIHQHLGHSAESAVLSALILGIKDHLDNDLTRAYASAGAMHVLAVSGLHVGIVFMILGLFLKPLKGRKYGKWLVLIINLAGLWSYAMITGFSPSVLRAVTMFSMISLADTSERSSNIYNTIAASALILLLYEPNYIYSVGFQLSYAAVIGIIYLQPKIYNLWIPQYWIIDKAWQITAVSIAAQLATFPLGLYYFHQFPSYFFISNLIVIPGVWLILHTGLAFLFGASVSEILGDLIAWIIEWMLWFLNHVVSLAEQLPGSLIDWVYLSFNQVLLVYAILLTMILVFHYQNLRWLYVSFSLACLLSFSYIANFLDSRKATAIKYYRAKNYPAIDFVKGGSSYLVSTDEFINSELAAFQIDPHRRAVLSNPVHKDEMLDPPFHEEIEPGVTLYHWYGHKVIHVTQEPQQQYSPALTCDELVISNNSIESEETFQNFNFKRAIADGSNFQSRKMLKFIDDTGIVNLNTEGAQITELNSY